MSHPLFVYGTLKTGESHAGMLGDLERRAARVRGRLYHLPAGYPALQLGGGEDVHGEVIAAPNARLLSLLDDYEGVSDGLYKRVLVRAIVGLTTVRAWAWVMQDPPRHGGRHLPAGRWTSPRRSW